VSDERAEILIVGGGIIGTSLAWALAARGASGVTVVDLDLAGVYAASELNAGGARATWWQPVNIEACRATLDFFAEHADEFGFRPRGYLWLYGDRALHAQALEKRVLQNLVRTRCRVADVSEVAQRFPLLDRALDELVGATFSPRDGLVNPNAVRAWFRREAEARGVRFLNRHYVVGRRDAARGGCGWQLAPRVGTARRRGPSARRARGRRARARDPRLPSRSHVRPVW
jgi:sarcosine oxidase subunit beta